MLNIQKTKFNKIEKQIENIPQNGNQKKLDDHS